MKLKINNKYEEVDFLSFMKFFGLGYLCFVVIGTVFAFVFGLAIAMLGI